MNIHSNARSIIMFKVDTKEIGFDDIVITRQ